MRSIGTTFVESMKGRSSYLEAIDGFDYPFTTSRLLMTESSMTIAGGQPDMIRQSLDYRSKLYEKSFESLNIAELCIIPSQLPMLLSEMALDGVVIDVGHELTQIVPFVDGRASYHKVAVFPVAGMFVDHLLSNYMLDSDNKKEV